MGQVKRLEASDAMPWVTQREVLPQHACIALNGCQDSKPNALHVTTSRAFSLRADTSLRPVVREPLGIRAFTDLTCSVFPRQ
jgi:hypothetical protein